MSTQAPSSTSTAPFTLIDLPLLSRSTVDRQEILVNDTAKQAELWPSGWVLVLDDAGRVTVRGKASELVFTPAATFSDTPPEQAVLLGEQD
ncbi:MAG TPA: NAD(+) diphosphatase, partial [Pseudonocardiaceae bacterium]